MYALKQTGYMLKTVKAFIFSAVFLACGCAAGPAGRAIVRHDSLMEDSARTFTVLKFNNLTSENGYQWLSNLFSDILIAKIAASGKYRVIMREQLDTILDEQELQQSGIIREETAVKIGNIIGINTILLGSYAVIGRTVNISVKMVDVSNSVIMGAVNLTGSLKDFKSLERDLAEKAGNMVEQKSVTGDEVFFSKIGLEQDVPVMSEDDVSGKKESKDSRAPAGLRDVLDMAEGEAGLADKMRAVDCILDEIVMNGIISRLSGEVEIRITNSYAPVGVNVPVNFWLSGHVIELIKQTAQKLGGNYEEGKGGIYFKVTDREEVNSRLIESLISRECVFNIFFRDGFNHICHRKLKVHLREFFERIGDSGIFFARTSPVKIMKRYGISSSKAERIDSITVSKK